MVSERLIRRVHFAHNPNNAAASEASRQAAEMLRGLGAEPTGDIRAADMIVTFGGDGTLLHTAACAEGTPILGVNMGRRGYLCALEREELPLLAGIARGEYRIERRMMLDVRVMRSGAAAYAAAALNDAVVSMGGAARMVSLSLYADGKPLMSFSGDGVILSTPTGSTAYSMAAGGPILEPEASALLITPICAHEIFARPLVLGPERIISVDAGGRGEAYLSVDGGEAFPLLPGDRVEAARSDRVTRLVHVKPINFYGQIYEKFR